VSQFQMVALEIPAGPYLERNA